MGFLDKFRAKATETVNKHGDQIHQGVDKAGAFADKKTGGKYTDKINTGKQKAKEGLDKLDDKKGGTA